MLLGEIAQRHTARCSTTGLFMGIVFFSFKYPFAIDAEMQRGASSVQCCGCSLEGSAPPTALPCRPKSLPAWHGAWSWSCSLFALMLQFVFTTGMRYLRYGKSVFSPNLLRLTGE